MLLWGLLKPKKSEFYKFKFFCCVGVVADIFDAAKNSVKIMRTKGTPRLSLFRCRLCGVFGRWCGKIKKGVDKEGEGV